MIVAIVLAAGRASRMGTPKQLLRIGGETLVRRAASVALGSSADRVLVVIGQSADEVAAQLEGLPVQVVRNPRFAEGQSTSLNAAIQALPEQTEAAVVMLVDQPLIGATHLDAVMDRYRADRPLLVVPHYLGRRGNPVLFDRALFEELLGIDGDLGAREVVQRHLAEAASVERDDPESQRDVDTWEEFQALKQMLEQADV